MKSVEEIKKAAILAEAVDLARKYGTALMDEASGSKPAIAAAAIMLSTFSNASGATDGQMIDVLMSVHKITKEFDGECK